LSLIDDSNIFLSLDDTLIKRFYTRFTLIIDLLIKLIYKTIATMRDIMDMMIVEFISIYAKLIEQRRDIIKLRAA
jgi:hypothetical protein